MSQLDLDLAMCRLTLAERSKGVTQPLTAEDVAAAADEILLIPMFGTSVDRTELVRKLEEVYTVWTDDLSAIGNDDDHVPWLLGRRGEIDWKFWNRYELYLVNDQKLSTAARDNVDKVSDEILARLENPLRDGPWDRRGLVMGNVQSGKTGTYTGLICKAADAGYKVIIVLAGLHNNLRSQTQVRLDEGFLGYKAAAPSAAGAMFEPTGVYKYGKGAKADSVTNRNEKGDFSKKVAAHFAIHPGGNPLLFVVKKNVSVLRNLLKWIESSHDAEDPSTGRKFHRATPLMVIDDEADQASVDTRAGAHDENGDPDPDHDPAKTNELIRSLLFAFEKSAYIGFTATPFANIFIHERARTARLGPDLFPRSFIINLPAPSNYTGAARIFGITEDEAAGLKASLPLPISRLVSDHAKSDRSDETAGWMPPKLTARTQHVPLHEGDRTIPPSLRTALMAFLVSTAVRSIREGAGLFNSMLIHVVRYTNVQEIVTEQVTAELRLIERRLRFGDGERTPSLTDECRKLWDEDFVPTAQSMGTEASFPPWTAVASTLPAIVASIKVMSINGAAVDALNFEAHRENGLNVIAIGGDKLSRGLTLEGLTVSYFLRASRMYDTLMQMGRWFGYKERYLDVCRLYTTSELFSWFRHIAAATEELRLEFDHMVSIGASPREYGLKIRAHPALLVTSAVKMRSGTTLQLSYAGVISETIIFEVDGVRGKNLEATQALIAKLGPPKPNGAKAGGYIWTGIAPEEILDFLAEYKSHPDARRADTTLLGRYIKRQLEQQELTSWAVVLASSSLTNAPNLTGLFGDLSVGGIFRDAYDSPPPGRLTIRRLVNPSDELSDLSDGELADALEHTKRLWAESKRKNKSTEKPTAPSAAGARFARPKTRGLLIIYPLDGRKTNPSLGERSPIIGIAMSFPASDTAAAISYQVNNVFADAGDYEDL